MRGLLKVALAVATVALVQMAVPTFADAAVGGIKKTPPTGNCGGVPCSALIISAGTGGTAIPWDRGSIFSFQLTKLTPIMTAPSIMSSVSAPLAGPPVLTAFDTTTTTPIQFGIFSLIDGSYVQTYSPDLAMESGIAYDLGYYLQAAAPSASTENSFFIGTAPEFVHLQYLTFDMPDFTETVTQAGVAPVPEPSTMLLLGIGIAGIAGTRRIRQRMKKNIC